jgi:hypothetical protein
MKRCMPRHAAKPAKGTNVVGGTPATNRLVKLAGGLAAAIAALSEVGITSSPIVAREPDL